jgi:5-methylcytosine-specific restriction enzyme subunit McrC
MLAELAEPFPAPAGDGIPIRNLWLLLVYANGLARFRDRFDAEIEASPHLPDLLARLLAYSVEHRLRRNLSRAYRQRAVVLKRVRGRIDLLDTLTHDRLHRTEIACRFEEPTVDTPRNRLVRAALVHIAGRVRDAELAHRCRMLARDLGRLGVAAGRPSRADLARDQVARHEADDLSMIKVAELALDLGLPSEEAGATRLGGLARDELILFDVFEKAVAGFYRHELPRDWIVRPQSWLRWDTVAATTGLNALLPQMQPDLILENKAAGRRIVLDTKFTGILVTGKSGRDRFKSGHIYQVYSYLRSQAARDMLSDGAEGVLLHPSLGHDVDESVTLNGHRIRFATVNLAADTDAVRRESLEIILG